MDQHAPPLADHCCSLRVRRLALFGSTLRGTQRPDSDVDPLVEFETDHEPGLIGLSARELELAAFFDGSKVDLRMSNDLSRHFRDEVQRTAELRHAA